MAGRAYTKNISTIMTIMTVGGIKNKSIWQMFTRATIVPAGP